MNLTNDYLKIMSQINANEHLLFFAQFKTRLRISLDRFVFFAG